MNRKLVFILTLALVLAAVMAVTACSSSPTTTSAPATTTTAPSATTSAPPPTTTAKPITINIGGTFALTGAYAEDVAACLQGYQDYTKWVNENHIVAPWYPDRKIPANWTVSVMWADDQLAPDKALTIYDQQKSAGLLVQRVSGSPEGLALIQKFADDNVGATTQSAGPYVLTKSQNIFPNYPIYTDSLAAVADWFKANWKETRAPRVAYITANNAMGKQIETNEFKAYLTGAGFEWAGAQYVDLIPTSPPTTQLAWLKDNKVDLALGVMVNPGSQATIKEAVRLGMGPTLDYKISFGFATPSHLQQFVPAMGQTGNGVLLGGGYAPWEDTGDGIKFAKDLLAKYHGGTIPATLYLGGIVESMTQLEVIRMASLVKAVDQLKPVDVLQNGFWKLTDFSTGGISANLTYTSSYCEGMTKTTVQQVQNGKIVTVGTYPLRNIFTKQ